MRQFRERIRNPAEVNEDNVLDGENDNAENQNDQAVINNNETDDTTEETAEIAATPPPSLWVVFSNMIYMFFASLFPENIQVN